MRLTTALAVLALAVGIAACGGSQEGTLGSAGTSTTPGVAQARTKPSDPNKSCAAQGIDSTKLGEGACKEGRIRYVVANRTSVLRLRELSVAITGLSVGPAVGGPRGNLRAQNGVYLKLTLAVQNRAKAPRRFTLGQTAIGIGDNNYTEAREAERKHPDALVNVQGGNVGPGETLRGDVLFDVLGEDIENIPREGRLFIASFGQRPLTRESARQLGQFRLYAETQQPTPQPAQR